MTLPLPKLDNRTFEQLLAEGRSLIPRNAPAWTDHNFHDPGLTLIELFAWLIEMDVYRLDRIGEASYRTFLRLLGLEVHGAQAAEAVLVLAQDPPASPIRLPEGLQVAAADDGAVFQTVQPVNVSPARLAAVHSGRPEAPVDHTSENAAGGRTFYPFGLDPRAGTALRLGFDRPLADESMEISLYVWSGDPAQDRLARQALLDEQKELARDAEAACPPGTVQDSYDWRLHYSARTVWEYYAGPRGWLALENVVDETRGLSLSGAVRFQAPLDHQDENGLFPIRCRLESGGYECPPALAGVALNAILARHAADAGPEEDLGRSNGRAYQRFALRRASVVPGSTRLRVFQEGEEQAWQEIAFWEQAGPHERAYRLLAESGEVEFGDGRSGRIPPAGAKISARYQVGGGEAGNLPAGSLTRILDNPHNAALLADWATIYPALRATQPAPALGGAGAETLAEAQARAVEMLAAQTRLVTLADFEGLALLTPGVPVARARAIPDYHPALPCFPAPGSVTVVVVPACPDLQPNPGPDFLAAVHRYLDRRRTLAAELHVIGPCYLPLRVSARLHTSQPVSPPALRSQAEQVLDAFFHPLTGGPDSLGWPVGRDVYQSEILALLNAIPGVDYVDELGFLTGPEQAQGAGGSLCSNVTVCPDCLVLPGQHQIQVVERRLTR
jgi:hypothetical protein